MSGNDLGTKSHFKWSSNGKSFIYTNWHPDEPNNTTERCVELWTNQKWNNHDCVAEKFFVCEIDLTTIPRPIKRENVEAVKIPFTVGPVEKKPNALNIINLFNKYY